MSDSATLPAGFESLEEFVSLWCVTSTAARAQRRFESSRDERKVFFDAMKDRQVAALDLLDRKPLRMLDEKEGRLLNLLLSFAHVALAIEVQGTEEERHRQMSRHMIVTRSVADR